MSEPDTGAALARVQRYECASRVSMPEPGRTLVRVGPFAVLFTPGDTRIDRNTAYPETVVPSALEPWLVRLHAAFVAHGGHTAVRIVDSDTGAGTWPLANMLCQAGFSEHEREMLLTCTRATLGLPASPPQLAITSLTRTAPLAAIRANMDMNERGFDPEHAVPVSAAHARQFQANLCDGRVFTASWEGHMAGAGMYIHPLDGVTELAGISTLQEYRERGIAAALTAHMASAAFARGCDLIYLTTSNPVAERVYRRVGFEPVGSLVTYVASA